MPKRAIDAEDMPRKIPSTPQEIAEACAKIQAGWSEAEKRRRWCYKGAEAFSLPTIAASSLNLQENDRHS